MVHSHDAIREHIVEHSGMNKKQGFDLASLGKSEWSSPFEKLMRNRLIMGALRYGVMYGEGTQSTESHVASIQKRLDAYTAGGNLEHLVDIANLCLVEFRTGDHKDRHFKAQDDNKALQVKETG